MILHRQSQSESRRGFVLITVLIVVVVLTLATYRYSDLMMAEFAAADSYARSAKAKAYAESGINYTAMLLSDPINLETMGGNPFHNPTAFQGILIDDNDLEAFRGRFSVVSPLDPDTAAAGGLTNFRYGCVDEAGKINLNGLLKIDRSGDAAVTMLSKLPDMTPDLANAIVDWLDADDDPRTGGAEADSYAGLGYRPRNGPLNSIEELLYVQGMTPQLLFGNDRNRNGILDPEEESDEEGVNQGLSAYLTVYSREQNVDFEGNPRIYLNDRNKSDLFNSLNEALGEDLARYLLAYQNSSNQVQPYSPEQGSDGLESAAGIPQEALGLSNRGRSRGRGSRSRSIASIFDLVDTVVEVPAQGRGQQAKRYSCPLNDEDGLKELLPLLLDKTTTTRDTDLPVRININTAPSAVIQALPGVEDDLSIVDTILASRPDSLSNEAIDEVYATPAWLLTEAGLDLNTLRTMERFITARTQVYRFQVVGHFDAGGPARRFEAIVDTNRGRPRIVYFRDLTELGRGFNIEAPGE